jgi:hypothetical protein
MLVRPARRTALDLALADGLSNFSTFCTPLLVSQRMCRFALVG